jgi:hypothetical protein
MKRRQSEQGEVLRSSLALGAVQSAECQSIKSGLFCTFNRGPPESRGADSSQWNGVALQRGEECANMR